MLVFNKWEVLGINGFTKIRKFHWRIFGLGMAIYSLNEAHN
jgi:hypothetical protein